MNSRAVSIGLVGVLFLGATAWAGVDPFTLEQIPDGQKYSQGTLTRLHARQMNAREEGEKIDAVEKARAAHLAALEDLKALYAKRADAEGMRKAAAEIEDIQKARQFVFMNWEDAVGELTVAQQVPEADKLLADADKLRKGANPFTKTSRFREAAALYKRILLEYPNSSATHAAAFGSGEVYRSGALGEYARAVRFYELSYLADPQGQYDAVLKAAQVCDKDLADYERAARWYRLAATMGQSDGVKQSSKKRLEQLQKQGFGAQEAADEGAAPAPGK